MLFRVALAILKLNEADILAAEGMGDVFEAVGGMTSRLWTAEKLITVSAGGRASERAFGGQVMSWSGRLQERSGRALPREHVGDVDWSPGR